MEAPSLATRCGTRLPDGTRQRHRIVHPSEWNWLPTGHGHLARHAWCAECGQVKVVGNARALDTGGLVNLLAWLDRELRDAGRHKITEAQRRLILKKLQAMEADDAFGLTRQAQLDMVARVVGQYLYMPQDIVATYLCHC